jgi:hypothetical protein
MSPSSGLKILRVMNKNNSTSVKIWTVRTNLDPVYIFGQKKLMKGPIVTKYKHCHGVSLSPSARVICSLLKESMRDIFCVLDN